jgi:hypothetical protein
MNIFVLSNDVNECAEWAVDRHVVKMILEYSQLLSTAHRVLDGTEYTDKTASGRNVKRWRLSDHRQSVLYSATHINHPCAVWTRESNNNYNWLYCLLDAYLKEYTHRYGKIHKIQRDGLFDMLSTLPDNIPIGYKTSCPEAMPDEYKDSKSVVKSYRNYYKFGKKHLHKYTKRQPPQWLYG